jgi:hypothetical protein
MLDHSPDDQATHFFFHNSSDTVQLCRNALIGITRSDCPAEGA